MKSISNIDNLTELLYIKGDEYQKSVENIQIVEDIVLSNMRVIKNPMTLMNLIKWVLCSENSVNIEHNVNMLEYIIR